MTFIVTMQSLWSSLMDWRRILLLWPVPTRHNSRRTRGFLFKTRGDLAEFTWFVLVGRAWVWVIFRKHVVIFTFWKLVNWHHWEYDQITGNIYIPCPNSCLKCYSGSIRYLESAFWKPKLLLVKRQLGPKIMVLISLSHLNRLHVLTGNETTKVHIYYECRILH